jgi:hypothetical protein
MSLSFFPTYFVEGENEVRITIISNGTEIQTVNLFYSQFSPYLLHSHLTYSACVLSMND